MKVTFVATLLALANLASAQLDGIPACACQLHVRCWVLRNFRAYCGFRQWYKRSIVSSLIGQLSRVIGHEFGSFGNRNIGGTKSSRGWSWYTRRIGGRCCAVVRMGWSDVMD
ncbi:hypothetical protein M7I_2809 [Glarea lozoyensis 74030]|uniref:Uncharacterized protein n=1 Tax=Glarea lozoyensis (strain ATCC 74030 / MF5533) TaxID=1104152 RepID=H0EJS9_GLAL7|nr:hypothetical protein M7I_2809 [Glarea lozoyensis 74030]